MSARHQLNTLLAGMSDSTLSLNDRDSCQFKCTNGMKCIVELIPNTSIALAYLPLKRLPDAMAARVATLEKALKMNLGLQKSLNACIIFDERMDQLTLSSQLDINSCNFDVFDTWLGNLIKRSKGVLQDIDRFEGDSRTMRNPQKKRTQLNQAIQSAVLLKI